jgi:hypothetical protein
VYADQTAVLGPLATYAEPHAYDLCATHSERLSAPRGWEVLRLAPEPAATGPSSDDLLALADAVREAARPVEPRPTGPFGLAADPQDDPDHDPDHDPDREPDPGPGGSGARGGGTGGPGARGGGTGGTGGGPRETGRRGHLRVLSTD